MSPMTPVLISYWHRLPAEAPAARRKTLDAIRDRARAGLEPCSALLPFALADVDDGIVAAATQAYVAIAADRADADPVTDIDAVGEATEWVRRGLALNPGAVFGALLALDDARALERLTALRLVLSAAEVESACRVLGAAPGPRASAFLRDWLALVADGALQRERSAIAGVLGFDRSAAAA